MLRYHVDRSEGNPDAIPSKCLRDAGLYLRYNITLNTQVCSVCSRLFFMMGLNWYIEIFISLFFNIREDGWVLFSLDSVNMLQGVWVFGNFICQKNIINILFKALTITIPST